MVQFTLCARARRRKEAEALAAKSYLRRQLGREHRSQSEATEQDLRSEVAVALRPGAPQARVLLKDRAESILCALDGHVPPDHGVEHRIAVVRTDLRFALLRVIELIVQVGEKDAHDVRHRLGAPIAERDQALHEPEEPPRPVKGQAFQLGGYDEPVACDHGEGHRQPDSGWAVEEYDVERRLDHRDCVAKARAEAGDAGEAHQLPFVSEGFARRYELKVGRGGRPNRFLDMGALHQHVAEMQALVLRASRELEGRACLRVHVDDERAVVAGRDSKHARLGEGCAEVDRGRGLGDSALAVDDRDFHVGAETGCRGWLRVPHLVPRGTGHRPRRGSGHPVSHDRFPGSTKRHCAAGLPPAAGWHALSIALRGARPRMHGWPEPSTAFDRLLSPIETRLLFRIQRCVALPPILPLDPGEPMKRTFRGGALVSLAALLGACGDQVIAPHGDANPLVSIGGRVPLDVPEVRIQLPPTSRSWDRSPAALASRLAGDVRSLRAAGDGEVTKAYAVIAFKEPASARALQTGVRSGVSARAVSAGLGLLRERGVEVVELLDHIGAARVRITPAAAEALAGDPRVDFVEPRQYVPLLAQTIPWGIAAVRAPQAWNTTTGVGTAVLIIDTGYDPGHSDLRALPIAHCAGEFGGCDDSTPWHGTHVLGILSARDNQQGVVGVGPGINGQFLYMYGACNSATQACAQDEIAAGLNWGIGLGVKVVNMSLGGFAYDAGVATAVAQAWNSGIVLVAAAGNNGNNAIVYPAGYPNVVGVSGVGSNLAFASGICGGNGYSSYGSHVDIAAPFEALSTVGDGGYATLCGTSMAAPHVAGAVALIRAKNPSWTATRVVNQLLASAHEAGTTGWDPYYGYGILDVEKAVGPELTKTFPSAPTVAISGPLQINQGQTYTWSAIPAGGNGSYTYLWSYRKDSSPTWSAVSTASSVATTAFDGETFHLHVTVASAGNTVEASRQVIVKPKLCDGCSEQ